MQASREDPGRSRSRTGTAEVSRSRPARSTEASISGRFPYPEIPCASGHAASTPSSPLRASHRYGSRSGHPPGSRARRGLRPPRRDDLRGLRAPRGRARPRARRPPGSAAMARHRGRVHQHLDLAEPSAPRRHHRHLHPSLVHPRGELREDGTDALRAVDGEPHVVVRQPSLSRPLAPLSALTAHRCLAARRNTKSRELRPPEAPCSESAPSIPSPR